LTNKIPQHPVDPNLIILSNYHPVDKCHSEKYSLPTRLVMSQSKAIRQQIQKILSAEIRVPNRKKKGMDFSIPHQTKKRHIAHPVGTEESSETNVGLSRLRGKSLCHD